MRTYPDEIWRALWFVCLALAIAFFVMWASAYLVGTPDEQFKWAFFWSVIFGLGSLLPMRGYYYSKDFGGRSKLSFGTTPQNEICWFSPPESIEFVDDDGFIYELDLFRTPLEKESGMKNHESSDTSRQ